MILIDELQEASDTDLVAINTAVHHLGQADVPLPVLFVGAGLPSLPAQLSEATSYAERLYEYRSIGLLNAGAAGAALTSPTEQQGVEWDPEALTAALALAAGYPYFLQSVGKHVWDVAVRSPITTNDVEVGGGLPARRSTRASTARAGNGPPRPSGCCYAPSPSWATVKPWPSPTSPIGWARSA